MNDNPRLSVIILTRNREEYLTECIQSVRKQKYPDYELVIVDNGSSDGTQEYIRNTLPEAVNIYSDTNLGIAEGRNRGASASRGDLLFFLDDDGTVREPDAFSRSVQTFDRDPDLAVLFGQVRDAETDGPQKCFFSFQTNKSVYPHPVYTDIFRGGVACIRKEIFERVGGFDPSYFMEAEEFDFSLRVLDADGKIRFDPGITLEHARLSTRGPSGRISSFNLRNYLITFWKNLPLLSACLFTLSTLATRMFNALRNGWILWYFRGVFAWLLRMPATFFSKRHCISSSAFKRWLILKSYPVEDYQQIEKHMDINLLKFISISRRNRKQRN